MKTWSVRIRIGSYKSLMIKSDRNTTQTERQHRI